MLRPKTPKQRFDGEGDAFITVNRDVEEVWAGQYITITDGSRIKAYALGAVCWTWREIQAVGIGAFELGDTAKIKLMGLGDENLRALRDYVRGL